MFKKLLIAFILIILASVVLFAQQVENQWEYLEVSKKHSNHKDFQKPHRFYNYLNKNVIVRGEVALERIGKAGWELVNTYYAEGQGEFLIFRRKYNEERTEKEIETFKSWELSIIADKPIILDKFNIVDLDLIKNNQAVEGFNKSEEEKLKNILENIKGLPIKQIIVKSNSSLVGKRALGAEVVIDATDVLLKDGDFYSSTETEKYFLEVSKKIIDQIPLEWTDKNVFSRAKYISKNKTAEKIGKFNYFGESIRLKIFLVIDKDGQENVVDFGFLSFDELKNSVGIK